MYINDVIERVKTYYPSEYDETEMYPWCDEVSSMIAIEDNCVYNHARLMINPDGGVILPSGVEFCNIVSVTAGGRVLEKTTLKNLGKITFDGVTGYADVVYLVPYTPIRAVRYQGTGICEGDTLAIPVNPFIAGDSLRMKTSEGERLVTVIDITFIADSDYPYQIKTGTGQLEGVSGEISLTLTREVTEKTLCSPPFDTMYVDYIMGKLALYQRDYQMYNQFMTSFNSRLDAYRRWLVNHIPQDGGVLKNFWKGR